MKKWHPRSNILMYINIYITLILMYIKNISNDFILTWNFIEMIYKIYWICKKLHQWKVIQWCKNCLKLHQCNLILNRNMVQQIAPWSFKIKPHTSISTSGTERSNCEFLVEAVASSSSKSLMDLTMGSFLWMSSGRGLKDNLLISTHLLISPAFPLFWAPWCHPKGCQTREFK